MKVNRHDDISDGKLLELYQNDHNAEWVGILLERYTLLLLGVCMKYLKDEHAARDAVQQIFLKVLTEVGKYKIDYFKSWLYMVAKNHCLMQLRNQQGRSFREVHENINAGEESDKSQLAANELTYQYLEQALKELNSEQRECVILFYLKKLTYQQISDKTGFTPMQVKSHIQNGKRNLKILMDRKGKQKHEG